MSPIMSSGAVGQVRKVPLAEVSSLFDHLVALGSRAVRTLPYWCAARHASAVWP